MSIGARSRGEWIGRGSGAPALHQLGAAVAALHRARWMQTLVEYLASGLCVALFAASALVLAARLGVLGWRPDAMVGAVLLAGIAVSAVLAWRHRPDDLDAAVAADVKLNLKQRMSTAWEFARERGDDELTRRLAAQAVHARLPGRSATVFPLRVNGLGLAAPVGFVLLVLVSIIDLDSPRGSATAVVDASVVSEGVRLREYGVRMQARAERDALTRSESQSRRLQELGSSMQAGALDRDEALDRLRGLGRELDAAERSALELGNQVGVGPVSSRPLPAQRSARGGSGAGGMLQRLADGELGEGDLRALASAGDALAGSGVSREQLDRALDALRNGDPQALRDALERIAQAERGRDDAAELRRARERLARARENLGDAPADPGPQAPDAPAATGGGTPAASAVPEVAMPDGGADEDGGGGSDPGLAGAPADRRPTTPTPAPGAGPTIEAQPRIGSDGDVFVSRARALPRASAPRLPERELAPQFEAQMEEVLASERYPAHYKDYIRRYFLGLSEGARGEEPAR